VIRCNKIFVYQPFVHISSGVPGGECYVDEAAAFRRLERWWVALLIYYLQIILGDELFYGLGFVVAFYVERTLKSPPM
jgi:hypothetical protein